MINADFIRNVNLAVTAMTTRIKAITALIITIILFSTFEVVSKIMTADMPPMQINFLRFIIGGLVLMPAALLGLKKGQRTVARNDWKGIVLIGILNVTICLTMFQVSIKYIPASAAAVIFCTNPVFVHIAESLLFKVRLSKQQTIGLITSLFGLAMIFGNEFLWGSGSWLGLGLALFSAATYGLYIVLAKNVTEKVGPLTANSFSFIAGAIACIPLMLACKVPIVTFDLTVLPHLVYLSLAVTALAYYLFLYGLQHLPAGTGSLVFFVKPVLASLLAFWLLHESITLLFGMGAAVIILGLLIYTKTSSKSTSTISR